jgi:hypothetical protein
MLPESLAQSMPAKKTIAYHLGELLAIGLVDRALFEPV